MKIDQPDFTDWMSLLPSNLVDENNPNPEAFSTILIQKPSAQIHKAFNQHGIIEKTECYVGLNTLIKPIVYPTYIGNKSM